MADAPARTGKPARKARNVSVVRTEQLSPGMVRVFLTGDDLAEIPELTFTDHYVKLLFPAPGADYSWPFDPEEIRADHPSEQWPVTRTYTIRSFDPELAELAIDFVVHGDEGLAGPWARDAQPGDPISFFGPGGAYAPEPDVDVHVLAGDEAALPAIAASLDSLPETARAEVYLEVESADHEQPLRSTPGIAVHWVHRASHRDEKGTLPPYGVAVAQAVRDAGLPDGRLQVFVHGNAEMVKDLRRYLFVESRIDRRQVSISGYWRTGHTEDRWQATKREFNEAMENEESTLAATS